MPPVGLQVKLLEMSERPLSLLYVAYRQCYSPRWAGDMWEEDAGEGRKDAFLREMMRSGHDSPLEHVKFTFAIAGVSRALTHQLVRYRVASYSQQSQRYVDMRHFGYVIPPSIAGDETLRAEFERCMAEIQQSYQDLLARFGEKGIVGERAHEDARFVLPQAAETKIVVTMNCRELLHFFSQRCCQRAQWEIRALANRMLELCQEKLPPVFENGGARCERLGYCPEGKFSCGRFPLKEEVIRGKNFKK
ncbi:MAG: FAD-dependent thymidylate synthase [Deltaproteobacteria bacterium RBG_13_52_11]|nr:MAG: FAD-dependent thymidylate synthase [Deltaproteobacteria bacterium RBG_13_52_11]